MSLRQVTKAAVIGLMATATLAACGGGPAGGHPAPPQAGAQPSDGPAGPSGPSGPSAVAPGRSGGASVPASRPAVTTAPGGTQCANAPSATVGKALGLAVGKLIASTEGQVTVCAYTGRYEVLVRYQVGENAGQFAVDRQNVIKLHQSVSPVTGLGDQAFFANYTVSKPASHTLAARKSGTAVFITSPASLGAERTLMAELLQKL